ncbi:exodeoxyribonuclease III [Sporosarcina sp. NCCP-2222]|uniref:exodeoxyribonuclease III n=1 Tax=Sporosarcina sp. NCCP-2222 TaxID=2935073 RepID=UPI00207DA696|nr:exodeoxyribonuclease III [Sporosarcina sp. NCCP-2222]GKV55491.1 exodeoxyribonuclease III [Sporosarcina sp. NCCP-2222]
MKLVSWNVNGLRACVKKGFLEYFAEVEADIFCVQETKLQEGQIDLPLEGYYQYWNYALKKGYSGTAIFTKEKPIGVYYGIGEEDGEEEGRIITAEFENFILVNAYVPNSQRDLARLPFRLAWEDKIREHLTNLLDRKPVIYCGDLNVAHQELDIRNVKSNIGNSGFTYEERSKMDLLLKAGFIDSFRHFYPDRGEAFTWWSYMNKVRERNIGWRIDYFLVSHHLQKGMKGAGIDHHIMGSDHCPVVLELEI